MSVRRVTVSLTCLDSGQCGGHLMSISHTNAHCGHLRERPVMATSSGRRSGRSWQHGPQCLQGRESVNSAGHHKTQPNRHDRAWYVACGLTRKQFLYVSSHDEDITVYWVCLYSCDAHFNCQNTNTFIMKTNKPQICVFAFFSMKVNLFFCI